MGVRYLHRLIQEDLERKMVFIGGPRQVGKTTLAKELGSQHYRFPLYLNWDEFGHRKQILQEKFTSIPDLVIFDEIHKYGDWKNYVKGKYDVYKEDFDILVTGSARLDIYRKGGDSLMGRYHYYRLHPFSVAEACAFSLEERGVDESTEEAYELVPGEKLVFAPSGYDSEGNIEDEKKLKLARVHFENLMRFGGFPEPFLAKDEKTHRRFVSSRVDRLVREDIRDVESLRDISALEVLVQLLPARVGSLLSINSLREDLKVAHKTMSHWMDILERFYYHYRIYPYNRSSKIKSLRKEPKLFLWDWSEVKDEGARFENCVGSHLLKLVHFLKDTQGYKVELHFLRDIEGREVDFLVTHDGEPWFAVEVKRSDKSVSKALKYFKKRLEIPYCFQVVEEEDVDFLQDGVRVMSAEKFLLGLV
jgi:predicted AAA+ superfamily ATPase